MKEEKIKELKEIYKDDEFLLRSELINLEHNNGWIKIESEEQRFPDEDLWICNFNGNKQPFIHYAYDFIPERYTHYQPIEKPQPPIY